MIANKVVLYSTQTCPFCKMAKAYFQAAKVPYTEYDVGADSEKATEMVEKSGQMGVPVIDINGRIIIGFDEPAIAAALQS